MADPSLTDRFPLLDRPVAIPGCCMSCRKGSVRVFDLRRNFFQHGAAYLCEECVGEMSRALNLVPAELVSAAEEKASRPFSEFLAAHKYKVVTDEFYDLVMGLVSNLLDRARDSDVLVSSSLAAREGEGASAELASDNGPEPESPEQSGAADAKANRSSRRKGPASVPSGTGDGVDPAFSF